MAKTVPLAVGGLTSLAIGLLWWGLRTWEHRQLKQWVGDSTADWLQQPRFLLPIVFLGIGLLAAWLLAGCLYWRQRLQATLRQVQQQQRQFDKLLEQARTAEATMSDRLQASEERWQLALDSHHDGIWEWQVKAHEIRFSPRWKSMLGYEDVEIADRLEEWTERIHPEDISWAIDLLNQHLDHKTPFYISEYRMRCRDGSYKWVVNRGQALWDQTGQAVRMVGIHTDVTDRHQTQATLTQQTQALEQAKQEAEMANRAKSAFLAMISHEIRTPLNAITGMARLLQETTLTPQQRDFAETIHTSSEDLLTIINDILDFSKIESGKLSLEQQPFDLVTCIEESLDLLALKAAEKNLELAYFIDPAVPAMIQGDETRLRQILVNLLSNAIKFTDRGEVTITVDRLVNPQSKPLTNSGWGQSPSEILFAVDDTGIGIPAHRMPQLFKPFSQGDASTSRRYGGTGLGLAISQRLSYLMGGSMWVESGGILGGRPAAAWNKRQTQWEIDTGLSHHARPGATFYFTIAAAAVLESPRPASSYPPYLTGKRLLIVTAHPATQTMLLTQTQAWGMVSQVAPSAIDAVNWLEAGHLFDLVILDGQVPLDPPDRSTYWSDVQSHGLYRSHQSQSSRSDAMLSSSDLAARIQQILLAQHVPLILLTAINYPQPASPADFPSPNITASLTKPIKQTHLYNALLQALWGRSVVPPLPSATLTQMDTHLGQDHPLRILLAEDNLTNQKVTLLVLEHLGYTADTATTGAEVMTALHRQPYDVILMDIQLADMSGLDVIHHIRQNWPPQWQPYIIAITANAMQGDREACLQAGANDYLSKPIRLESLESILRHHTPPPSFPPHSPPLPPPHPTPHHSVTHPPSPLDPQTLQTLRTLVHNSPSIRFDTLIDCYLTETAKYIQQIRTAIEQQDGAAISQVAHVLKSSSASFGAVGMAKLGQDLENLGRQSPFNTPKFAPQLAPQLAAMLPQLESEYERVKIALQREY